MIIINGRSKLITTGHIHFQEGLYIYAYAGIC